MNKDNILKVADAIEQHSIPGLGFNMRKYFCPTDVDHNPDLSGHTCGTTACIAGWAIAVRDGGNPTDFNGPWLYDAAEFMGLWKDEQATKDLMLETNNTITPAHAVAVLRHLAETGEVDWSVGAPVAS